MNTEERQLELMFTAMVGYSAMAQRDEALALIPVREQADQCVLGIPMVTLLPIPYSPFFSVRVRTQ